MHVLDASVWVSLFFPEDMRHAETVAWVTQVIQGQTPFAAPILVLPEVAGAVARRSGVAAYGTRAAGQVARFPALTLASLDEPLAALATDLAARAYLRGSDATYVALALRLGAPLVTWDAQQRDRTRQVVATYSPLF